MLQQPEYGMIYKESKLNIQKHMCQRWTKIVEKQGDFVEKQYTCEHCKSYPCALN
jgi:hypothetical protein